MARCDSIADAIRDHRPQSEAALLAIRGEGSRLTISGLLASAEMAEADDYWQFCEKQLRDKNLDGFFVDAMAARDVSIGPSQEEPMADLGRMNFDQPLLGKFLLRAYRQRCSIRVNGAISGSGCLIGPSLVLTAWHVVRDARPQGSVQVGFYNANSGNNPVTVIDGSVLWDISSDCTEDELQGKFPAEDALYIGHNDVAVIRLVSPEGMRVGFLKLPPADHTLQTNDNVCLMHYPGGRGNDVSFNAVRKIRNITARWKYAVGAQPGSSGGPCVNTKFALVGIHQGAWEQEKRLVPASLFLQPVAGAVSTDIAPTALWSLDDALDGRLVLGRDRLFECLAGANRPGSKTRGIRIKRRKLNSEMGLNFSLDAVTAILAREPDRNVVVRIAFESSNDALFPLLLRGLQAAGYNISLASDRPGADLKDTTLEANLNEAARAFAAHIEGLNDNGRAEPRRFWFLFENAAGGIREVLRLQFEAFWAAAIANPNLRIVVAGFETISTPGAEEAFPRTDDTVPAHVVVEYIGEFTRGDVVTLFERAGLPLDATAPGWADTEADLALQGLPETNGRYDFSVIEEVIERVRTSLKRFLRKEAAE